MELIQWADRMGLVKIFLLDSGYFEVSSFMMYNCLACVGQYLEECRLLLFLTVMVIQ